MGRDGSHVWRIDWGIHDMEIARSNSGAVFRGSGELLKGDGCFKPGRPRSIPEEFLPAHLDLWLRPGSCDAEGQIRSSSVLHKDRIERHQHQPLFDLLLLRASRDRCLGRNWLYQGFLRFRFHACPRRCIPQSEAIASVSCRTRRSSLKMLSLSNAASRFVTTSPCASGPKRAETLSIAPLKFQSPTMMVVLGSPARICK